MRLAILDESGNVIPATVEEWGRFFEGPQRFIAEDEFLNRFCVSTVFLGLNHNYSTAPNAVPLWFETMIFDGRADIYLERCTTLEQAKKMHSRAVAWLRSTKLQAQ